MAALCMKILGELVVWEEKTIFWSGNWRIKACYESVLHEIYDFYFEACNLWFE